MNPDYEPGLYVKDGQPARRCRTAAQAVDAVWNGFRRQTAENADYRDLQRQAKELGIPANQSGPALQAAIDQELSKPPVAPADADDDNDH